MKLKMRLIVAASVVAITPQISFAVLQAPLPEFKSKAELQKTAQQKQEIATAADKNAFYTGKPYESNREGYLFKYRSYDPKLNRWTSIDPSGFPDGANTYKYGNSPTNGFDPDGLTWAEAAAMFYDWITGSGPSQRNFADGSSDLVDDLKDAPGVNNARDKFFDKNKNESDPHNYQSLTNFKADFGLSGLFAAGGDSTEQFIGSYRVDITKTIEDNHVYANFKVTNTTSATSFFYGVAPSWTREQFGPGGNMTQTYNWKEQLE